MEDGNEATGRAGVRKPPENIETSGITHSPKANDMECDGLPSLSFLAPKGDNAGETPANRVVQASFPAKQIISCTSK